MILGEWMGFHRYQLEKQLKYEGADPDAVEPLMIATIAHGPVEFSTDKGRYIMKWTLARGHYKEWELKKLSCTCH